MLRDTRRDSKQMRNHVWTGSVILILTQIISAQLSSSQLDTDRLSPFVVCAGALSGL
jgi:hypothetical protein